MKDKPYVKKPIEYCVKFDLFSRILRFDHNKFLDELWAEMLEYYRNDKINLTSSGIPNYNRWNQIVNNYYQKFQSINRLMSIHRKDHKTLSKKLWGFFYARYIIPFRDSKYPYMAQYIYQRKRNLDEQDKNYTA